MTFLPSDLTVYIPTHHRSTLPEAQASVQGQTITPKRVVLIEGLGIREVYKFIKRDCDTPLCCKVDDDMMVHLGAMQEMLEVINRDWTADTALWYWHLWDQRREMSIESIKIYSTAHLKQAAFMLGLNGKEDRAFLLQCKAWGWTVRNYGKIMGVHLAGTDEDQAKSLALWRAQV